MNTEPNDGGPAFPLQCIGPDFPPGHAGMSLLDHFAGQALVGILANPNNQGIVKLNGKIYAVDEAIWIIAADMIKSRKVFLNKQ